jgi:mannose-6-phosphate isomerase-like protein (cupin superfamily)
MFRGDITGLAKENKNFRKVIYTGQNSQLVLMSLLAKEEIGMETHDNIDQVLFFAGGIGEATVAGKTWKVKEGDAVFVPAGARHNFKNTGKTDLKLYTIYSPPEHADGTVHRTKKEAMLEEH